MSFWEIFLICLLVFLVISGVVYCCRVAAAAEYVQEQNNNHVYVTTRRRRRFFYKNNNTCDAHQVVHQTPPIFSVQQPPYEHHNTPINGNIHELHPQPQQQQQQQQHVHQVNYIEMPPTYDEVIIQRPIRTATTVHHY